MVYPIEFVATGSPVSARREPRRSRSQLETWRRRGAPIQSLTRRKGVEVRIGAAAPLRCTKCVVARTNPAPADLDRFRTSLGCTRMGNRASKSTRWIEASAPQAEMTAPLVPASPPRHPHSARTRFTRRPAAGCAQVRNGLVVTGHMGNTGRSPESLSQSGVSLPMWCAQLFRPIPIQWRSQS